MTEGHAEYFIGRRREQEDLLPGLRSGALNTVLLTGLGGVGKSALATRLARALEKDDFVPIAVPSADDNSLTAGRLIDRCYEAFLAEDADGPYQRLRSEQIELRDKLRLLVQLLNRNRFVLVLDDFERNVDRASHEILDDTLAWFLPYLVENLTGESRCLVTSRYRPADLGDSLPPVVYELSLADFPESAFFKYLLNDDTVRRRYRPGDLPHDLLSRVYDLLGGTPRFLEQVREVLRDMPADELEAALDEVDLPEDADENHLQEIRDEFVEYFLDRGLYATIEPAEAREALSRAAVYTIPMVAEGYAVAANVDEATLRDWLDEWRRRTFVAPVPTDDVDTERWVIPTLLRPWLLKQIDENERREAHRAAGEWLMEVNEADLEDQRLGLSFQEVELEARSRFLDAKDYERARLITDRLSDLFVQQGLYNDVVQLNEEMLEHERHSHPMNWLGRVYRTRGKYGKAKRWHRDALKAAETRDQREVAVAHHGLGLIAAEEGEYKRARKELEEALQVYHELGDRAEEASTLHQLATILVEQGEYERAQDGFREALQIRREIGYRAGEASTRHQLGTVALEQGDYERAREEFESALRIYEEVGDRSGEASARHNLASVAQNLGKYDRAREEFEEALRIHQEVGDRRETAVTRYNRARIALAQGDYEEARSEFEEALEIYREFGDRSGEAATRHQLATIALERGDYAAAAEAFEEALRTYQEIGDRSGEAATRHQLATIALERGDYGAAEEAFEEALRIRQEIGDRSGEAATRHQLATIALNQGNYAEARSGFAEVLEIRQEIGDRSGEATTFGQLGNVAAKLDNTRGALWLHLLAFQILSAINHRHQQTALSHVTSLASELGLSQDELETVAQEVAESYAEDRGWRLIQDAFPDADIPDEVPPPE